MENLEKLLLPKGLIIKVGAIPYALSEDTIVLGRKSNIKLEGFTGLSEEEYVKILEKSENLV